MIKIERQLVERLEEAKSGPELYDLVQGAIALEHSNSPEAILQLLHEREKAFKEYRDEDRKLINCLSPAVNVLRAFSGIIGEAVSQVKPETMLTRWNSPPRLTSCGTWPKAAPARAIAVSMVTAVPAL